MSPLVVAVIIGLAGAAGGYIGGASALFPVRRERWRRGRDLMLAALDGSLTEWPAMAADDPVNGPIPYPLLVGDEDLLAAIPINPDRKERRRLTVRWARFYLACCNSCQGIWFTGLTLAVWAIWAALAGDAGPVSWPAALPTLGAGLLVHLAVTGAGNRTEIW